MKNGPSTGVSTKRGVSGSGADYPSLCLLTEGEEKTSGPDRTYRGKRNSSKGPRDIPLRVSE